MNNTIAVIPSSWLSQNHLFPGVYDLMVLINWKPTIDYILRNLSRFWVKKSIVIINENDEESFRYLSYRKNILDLVIIKTKAKSLFESINMASEYIINDSEVLIHFSDWIYNWFLDMSSDNILVQSNKKLKSEERCFIDSKNHFINNPKSILLGYKITLGLYYIKKGKDFFQLLWEESFYNALSKYAQTNRLSFQNIEEWYYNIWNLDEYYKAKIDFLRFRTFNTLEYNNFTWIITKKSTNDSKLLQEIHWFKDLPESLKIFTPRLIDYSMKKDLYYSLEFYGYNSMADIFLSWSYSEWFFKKLLEKMFNFLSYIKLNYCNKNFSDVNFKSIYFDKTFSRLEELLENDFMNTLYNKKYIYINWKKYKNIPFFIRKERLSNIIKKYITNTEDITIIHWDLCFSNILFDINNWIFKLIDPRWEFGEIWIWWDLKYDLAKLRHSVHWNYESIIADLYKLEYSIENDSFKYSYFNWVDNWLIEYFDNSLTELGYSVNIIKFIEALLYLTMIPLHSDSLDRQIMMYLTAVILFNETEELWKMKKN